MNIWEKTFIKKEWGKYPPEDLIRTVCNFKNNKNLESKLSILEMGSGPGANAIFLCNQFDSYAAIDISQTAINKLKLRLKEHSVKAKLDLHVACFSNLPWKGSVFDFVCDNLAITHNTKKLINETLEEVSRVIKPGGIFFSKVWGTSTFGLDSRFKIESGTYCDLTKGPCANLGTAHFFDLDEIIQIYGSKLKILSIEKVLREKLLDNNDNKIEQFIIISTKN